VQRSHGWVGSAVRAVDDDAGRWAIAPVVAWALLVLPLVLMASMMAIGALDEDLFHVLIDEDHPIEWTQFFVILAASGAFALGAGRARRAGRSGLAVAFAAVALGAFLVAGEEISWGQRILGFATPEALEPINHQGEANIHNISVVQRAFNIGEMLVGLYGLVLPIAWSSPSIRARVGRRLDSLLVPPLCLVVVFLLPFAYRVIRLIALPDVGERIVELGEVPELTLYVGTLTMGVVTARILRTSPLAGG
jgi:hypothetical protein